MRNLTVFFFFAETLVIGVPSWRSKGTFTSASASIFLDLGWVVCGDACVGVVGEGGRGVLSFSSFSIFPFPVSMVNDSGGGGRAVQSERESKRVK